MPIETKRISDTQTQQLLSKREGHYLDFKAKEIKPSKLSETASAFANSDGGEIYVGVKEEGDAFSWDGFSTEEDANGHIQVLLALSPAGSFCQFCFLQREEGGGFVLQIQIFKSKEIIKSSDDRIYIRQGAGRLPVDTDEALRRLEYSKGLYSYENQIVNLPLEFVTNSKVIIEFIIAIVPSREPEEWLHKQRVLIGKDQVTVAGVLLFSEEPQAILPKRCGIKVYRYKTSDKEGIRDTLAFDPISIEGDIYHQIYSAVSKVVELVQSIEIMTDDGMMPARYPREALHEIITNAVLHRDYSIAADVHVRIFDNRVEIESPGKLPGHVTVKNIMKEQFARNGTLVRLINKFPDAPNKDVGEGLDTAFKKMRDVKLKEPVIEQRDNSVLVSLRHEALDSPAAIIMEYLKNNAEINNSTGRGITFIPTESVMEKTFKKMIANGLIERVPNKKARASAYRLKVK